MHALIGQICSNFHAPYYLGHFCILTWSELKSSSICHLTTISFEQLSPITELPSSRFHKHMAGLLRPRRAVGHLQCYRWCRLNPPRVHVSKQYWSVLVWLYDNRWKATLIMMIIKWWVLKGSQSLYERITLLDVIHGAFLRHFKVRWIVQEIPIYHRVEESLLYQNPRSVNSANFSFSRYAT